MTAEEAADDLNEKFKRFPWFVKASPVVQHGLTARTKRTWLRVWGLNVGHGATPTDLPASWMGFRIEYSRVSQTAYQKVKA